MNTLDAYVFLDENGYEFAEYDGPLQAISMPVDGICAIGINYSLISSTAEERAVLFHEIGHCETGSFYNRWATNDVRQRHETRADRWAYKKLVPEDELDEAVVNGYTETWELADHFNVPEPFIIKAIEYYKMLESA